MLAQGGSGNIHVFDVVTPRFHGGNFVGRLVLARKHGRKPGRANLFCRAVRQTFDFVFRSEGFWRRRTADLFEEVWSTRLVMIKGVAEDTDEEVPLEVVCTRTRSSRDVEDILESQRVKV